MHAVPADAGAYATAPVAGSHVPIKQGFEVLIVGPGCCVQLPRPSHWNSGPQRSAVVPQETPCATYPWTLPPFPSQMVSLHPEVVRTVPAASDPDLTQEPAAHADAPLQVVVPQPVPSFTFWLVKTAVPDEPSQLQTMQPSLSEAPLEL